MEIKLKIPKEFEEHFNMDRFEDSLGRIHFDIKKSLFSPSGLFGLSGRYEMELAEMLRDTMLKAEVIKEEL